MTPREIIEALVQQLRETEANLNRMVNSAPVRDLVENRTANTKALAAAEEYLHPPHAQTADDIVALTPQDKNGGRHHYIAAIRDWRLAVGKSGDLPLLHEAKAAIDAAYERAGREIPKPYQ